MSDAKKKRNIFLVLKQSVIDIYNHLGYSLLVSVLWFLVSIPVTFIFFDMLMVSLEQQDNPITLLFLFFDPRTGTDRPLLPDESGG